MQPVRIEQRCCGSGSRSGSRFEWEAGATSLVPFLMLNRMGLTILLHPQSGRPRDDHTLHASWMGQVLPVKTEVLREVD